MVEVNVLCVNHLINIEIESLYDAFVEGNAGYGSIFGRFVVDRKLLFGVHLLLVGVRCLA